MANEKNYVLLAKLIQKVAGTEEGKTPEETIRIATKSLKKNQKFDFELEKKLKKVGLTSEEIQIEKENLLEWTTFIKKKFGGEPSVKSWAHLNFVDKGILNQEASTKDLMDDEVYNADELEDNDFDVENGITLDDIGDMIDDLEVDEYMTTVYDRSDFEDLEDEEELEEEVLDESLSRAARIKKRNLMKRLKGKIAAKRKLALKKHATMDVLRQRAKKLAIRLLKKKFAKKSVGDMSIADKERVEKLLKTKKTLVDRMTIKLIPVVKRIEKDRFEHKKEE